MVAIGGLALLAPAGAAASGGNEQFKVTFSFNCDHASCLNDTFGGGLGGSWGSLTLMQGGSGNGQLTFCGHTVRGGGPGLAGASHSAIPVGWAEATGITTPPPLSTGVFQGVLTATDPSGNYLVVDGGVLVVPATPGHYSITTDGVNDQITVAP